MGQLGALTLMVVAENVSMEARGGGGGEGKSPEIAPLVFIPLFYATRMFCPLFSPGDCDTPSTTLTACRRTSLTPSTSYWFPRRFSAAKDRAAVTERP